MRKVGKASWFAILLFFVAGNALAQAVPGSARIIRAARRTMSAPLTQLASQAQARPDALGEREINPLGMPPLPLGPNAAAATDLWVDPVRRDPAGLAPAPAPYLSFEGINNRNSVVPPDTNGDVGKDHYVQWVNLSLAVYDKTTGITVLGPVNGNVLWAALGGVCATFNSGDPIVLYDHLADRWILSQFALAADGHQCLAVSQTGDPTGAYFLYDFIVTPGGSNDYPKLGLWPNAYLYMANEFTPGFSGAIIGGFDRQKLLAGDPTATGVVIPLPPGFMGATHFAPEPANLEGATAPPAGRPGLFIQPIDSVTWGGAIDRYNIWKVTLDFDVPANSTAFLSQLSTGVPAFSSAVCPLFGACIPQPGTSRRLDSVSQFTMYRPVYRNMGTHEVLLVNHTVNAGAGVAGIRWTEIRDPFGAPLLYQTGTHSPDSNHRFMGSLAMDGKGDILLGYSISSSSVRPSIAYAGRRASDTLGALPLTESVLIGGTGSQTGSSRWGDYSAMSVDELGDSDLGIAPDCGFWYTSEYIQTSGSIPWRTRIGAFQIPGCGTEVPPVVKLAVNGQHPASNLVSVPAGTAIRLTLDMTPGTETRTLSWYYAIVIGGQVYWVTSTGISTAPGTIAIAPPTNVSNATLFNLALPRGTELRFVFVLWDGTKVVALDSINVVVI